MFARRLFSLANKHFKMHTSLSLVHLSRAAPRLFFGSVPHQLFSHAVCACCLLSGYRRRVSAGRSLLWSPRRVSSAISASHVGCVLSTYLPSSFLRFLAPSFPYAPPSSSVALMASSSALPSSSVSGSSASDRSFATAVRSILFESGISYLSDRYIPAHEYEELGIYGSPGTSVSPDLRRWVRSSHHIDQQAISFIKNHMHPSTLDHFHRCVSGLQDALSTRPSSLAHCVILLYAAYCELKRYPIGSILVNRSNPVNVGLIRKIMQHGHLLKYSEVDIRSAVTGECLYLHHVSPIGRNRRLQDP